MILRKNEVTNRNNKPLLRVVLISEITKPFKSSVLKINFICLSFEFMKLTKSTFINSKYDRVSICININY